jgi:hypothetical protein
MNGELTPSNQIKNTTFPAKKYGGIFLVGICVVAFVALLTQSAKLTCGRIKPSAPVNCTKQVITFWLIASGEEDIRDVLSAKVVGGGGGDCTLCNRVELLTGQGYVPLTDAYTTGFSAKQDATNSINNYVRGVTTNTLIVIDPGLLSADNLVLVLIGVAALFFWARLKAFS